MKTIITHTDGTVEEFDDRAQYTPSSEELKAMGEHYNGYQIPFKNDDAIGMMQVAIGFQSGAITETNIEFSNGVIMPIKVGDFDAFNKWFAQKRNSFFVG